MIDILQTAERLGNGKYVTIQIDDGLVRDYAQKLVRENYGVFEQGLNATIVKFSPKSFTALVLAVMPEDEQQKLIEAIPEEVRQKCQDERQSKTPIRLFIEGFSESAGQEAGKQFAKLPFTILTGGLNNIDEALGIIKETIQK